MKTLAREADKLDILRRIGCLLPEARARWGKMSSHQMLCHLSDAFRAGLGEKQASNASGLFQRTVMKYGALYFPMPWPKGVPTRPEMEQGIGGTVPVAFDRDRLELLLLLNRFCALGKGLEKTTHPVFGAMSENEWLRWGFLHADHHLRQFGT